ncbi:MAG TPA: XkdF-like putative serine protease domain-containing protein [Microlunatus sp.]
MSQTPQLFADLVTTLYGEVVDPDAIWEFSKRSPDQADVHVNQPNLRRNVERASNAVGITAGTLGLAGALKDKRLKRGGRTSRFLYATGQKMPKVLGRIKSRKVQAGLAAGAVGTQVLNLGGDALIAGTLGKQPKRARKSDYALAKRGMLYLVPTEVAKARWPGRWPGSIHPVVQGLRTVWTGESKNALVGKPSARKVKVSQPKDPATRQQRLDTSAKHQAQGAKAADFVDENKGKMAAGAATGTAAYGISRARRRQTSYEYVPDLYKRDDSYEDVLWEGTFSKVDTDRRLAFGWASVSKVNGSPVVDKQGDYIDLDDLEEAAYNYVRASRVGGDMHRRATLADSPHKVSDMVESFVITDDKVKAMNLPESTPRGWWVGYKIHDDQAWDLVKKGLRTGFSIHGKGLRKAQDLDELMGVG